MNHLIDLGADATEIMHAIESGNVGDLYTVQSTVGKATHRAWISFIIRKAKEVGVTLKRETSYENAKRSTVEGKVGQWNVGTDFFTELRKHAAVVK